MIIPSVKQLDLTLEEWMQNPPDGTEWADGKVIVKHPVEFVNGEVVGKPGMTAKTRRIQARLVRSWGIYMDSSGQGGRGLCGSHLSNYEKRANPRCILYYS
ncbi:hypothetical protein [Microcoleus sp. N9_B4]|uniref:hypothetical protein n=1 Tax=Microcoleus sp. N9_B4 TaxID=3055386 RepID=UPI002FD0026E